MLYTFSKPNGSSTGSTVEEYTKASEVYQQKYVIQKSALPSTDESKNLHKMLSEIILKLKKESKKKNSKTKPEIKLIVRRLNRIEKDLKKLLAN